MLTIKLTNIETSKVMSLKEGQDFELFEYSANDAVTGLRMIIKRKFLPPHNLEKIALQYIQQEFDCELKSDNVVLKTMKIKIDRYSLNMKGDIVPEEMLFLRNIDDESTSV